MKGDDSALAGFRALLEELEIPFVDLYPAYREQALPSSLFSFRDECHPNAQGHRLAALRALPRVKAMLPAANR